MVYRQPASMALRAPRATDRASKQIATACEPNVIQLIVNLNPPTRASPTAAYAPSYVQPRALALICLAPPCTVRPDSRRSRTMKKWVSSSGNYVLNYKLISSRVRHRRSYRVYATCVVPSQFESGSKRSLLRSFIQIEVTFNAAFFPYDTIHSFQSKI